MLERAEPPADRSAFPPAPHFQGFLDVGQMRSPRSWWPVGSRGGGGVMKPKAGCSLTVRGEEKRRSV